MLGRLSTISIVSSFRKKHSSSICKSYFLLNPSKKKTLSSHLYVLNYLLLDCTYFFIFPLLIAIHINLYLTLDNYHYQFFHVHGEWNLLQSTAAQLLCTFFGSDLLIFVTTLIFKLFWLWLWPHGPGYFDRLVQK